MGVIKRTDLGIHRLKDTAAYINRNHFCRLNATAARLKSALSGEAWWACMQNRTVRGGHLNWIFLWSSFQCAVIELSNVAIIIIIIMKSIPRAMTLMNNLPRKYPCSEIKGEMNAASCAVATLFFAHITIYFELNCYPVLHVLSKFNFPGAYDETNSFKKYKCGTKKCFLAIFLSTFPVNLSTVCFTTLSPNLWNLLTSLTIVTQTKLCLYWSVHLKRF